MSLVARYRELFAIDGVRSALTFSVVGRLSVAMTGLASLLLVSDQTGSYATAGAVSAAFSLSFAVGSPTLARIADRRGPVRVLLACSLLHPLLLSGLAVAARADVPTPWLLLAGALAGASFPPVGAVMRELLRSLATGPQLVTAYSLESVVVEVSFVTGPALVGVLVALASPFTALLVSAGCVTVGGIGLARSPAVGAVRPHPDAVHSALGPLTSAAVRALLLTVVFVGIGFGAIEVAVPAFADAEGHRAASGVLLALLSLGSMVGGLVYGGLHVTAPPLRQLPWLLAGLALTGLLPAFVPNALLMGVVLFAYGLTVAPYFSCNSLLLGQHAASGTTTEAFAWHSSMIFGGAALGAAGTGFLVQHVSIPAALAVTGVAGVLTMLSALAGRSRVEVAAASVTMGG